jgi:hypothetical protein
MAASKHTAESGNHHARAVSAEDWIDIDIDSILTNSGPPIPKIPPSEPINWSRVLLPLLESCLLPKLGTRDAEPTLPDAGTREF